MMKFRIAFMQKDIAFVFEQRQVNEHSMSHTRLGDNSSQATTRPNDTLSQIPKSDNSTIAGFNNWDELSLFKMGRIVAFQNGTNCRFSKWDELTLGTN